MKKSVFVLFLLFLFISCSKTSEYEYVRYLHKCVGNECKYINRWVITVNTKKENVVIKTFSKDEKPLHISFSKKCKFQNQENWDCLINFDTYDSSLVMIEGNLKFKDYTIFSDNSALKFFSFVSEKFK